MLVSVVVLLRLVPAALADQSSFVGRPTFVKHDAGAIVRFALSLPTDVEVAVLDGEGNVVRHLAAGLLGPNAPEPFQKNSLVQELRWDGMDDFGRPVSGRVKARVALGLRPRLDKVIGWSGQDIGRPCGLACGPDGTLYAVFGESLYAHRQTWLIAAFDRNGKYQRQVFPGPAGLPPEKRKGWPWIRLQNSSTGSELSSEEIPVVFHPTTRCPYPGAVFGNRMFPAVTRDGRLVMLSGAATGTTIADKPDIRGGRRLLILGCDGSVPENFLGPVVADEKLGGFGHVALSPDDKWVYIAGLFEAGRQGRGLCHVVWRVAIDGSSSSEVFVGELYQAGKANGRLNDPQGLAVGQDGSVFVADYGNDRIAVFKPDGSFTGQIAVARPDQVRVHRKTGAIYVLTLHERKYLFNDDRWYNSGHNWKAQRIVKFHGVGATTEAASFVPAETQYGGGALLALDDSEDQAVLWYVDNGWGKYDVLKIVDRGDKLEPVGDPIHAPVKSDETLNFIGDVAVAGDTVLVRGKSVVKRPIFFQTFSAETGHPKGLLTPRDAAGKGEDYWKLCWSHIVAGWDGRLLYIHGSGQTDELRRYDVSGAPAPFTEYGSHVVPAPPYPNRQTHNTTLFVNRQGDIYYVVRKEGQGRASYDLSTTLNVRVLASNGKVKNESAVSAHAAKLGGLAVDSKGNIYVGARLSFSGEGLVPPWFAEKLPPDSPNGYPSLAYKQCGWIIKFPPTGGSLVKKAGGRAVEPVNALWVRRGGLVPDLKCTCEATRIDIDAYDRLFVPDVLRFSVRVLDAAGNEITHIGGYGNMDSRGPGSPVPDPEIGLGWPIAVDCAGEKAYVADEVNRRVLAVRFEHAAVETVDATP